ncbi:MAG TPA: choice-of-anchor D domain-containing protein, partial [Nitrospirae bacterium]|nr:choice-of-anchor D domain-containing protein [Nitrospirota bacterium]
RNNGYASYSGTSMATPHVSGVAGLVKALNPAFTNLDIINSILNTADPTSSLSGKVASGGRLNAYNALTGVVTTPDISAAPPSKDFGTIAVGSFSPSQIFTISNDGTADLVIGSVFLTGTNPYQFSILADNCSGQTIAPSGTCTIEARYEPTKTGTMYADISIGSNDPDTPTLYIDLTGTGIASEPDIAAGPASKDYGTITIGSTSPAETFTISNNGTADLIISTVSLTGTDPAEFAIQVDNCAGQTIVPAGTCTIDAVFAPTSAGAKSADISIGSNDPDTPTLSIPLIGSGSAAGPDISANPASKDFGNVKVGDLSPAQAFTVSNNGTADLVISSVYLSGTNSGQFSITYDTCSGATIIPSGTCIVDVKFNPTAEGTFSANLSIPSNDSDTPVLDIPLSGTGVNPDIAVTPASHDFGNVAVGMTSLIQTFTVSNNGSGDLVINNVYLTGTNPYQFSIEADNCNGQTIASSGSCTIDVSFKPTSTGAKNADLLVASNDPDTPTLSIPLTGTGVPAEPDIAASPASKDYGTITIGSTSPAETFTISNNGTADLIISTVSLTGADPAEFAIQVDNCAGQTIVPAGTCTIDAVFAPTGTGAKSADISIASNDPDTPALSIPLTGTGVAAEPDIAASPASMDYGSVIVGSTSLPETFTISNNGTADLIISTVSLTGTDPAEFAIQVDNCTGQTVLPSGSCTIDAVFAPTGTGAKSADISIASNDPDTPTLSIPLTGTGLTSSTDLVATPSSKDYGDVTVGDTSSVQTFTVTNNGDSQRSINSVYLTGSNLDQFSIQNDNCSNKHLEPSENCTIDAVFIPTGTGVKNAEINVDSVLEESHDTENLIIPLRGTGIEANTPPVADPGGPYTATEGQAITLDGSGSTDSDGTITLYEWDIDNDGTFDYSSSSPTQSHTYAQQGTYTINLRVTDDAGATDEATTTATVSDTSPTADFTGSPTSGLAPLTVNFTDNSTGYDQPLSHEWDFDNDGVIDSTVQNPSYTYNTAGTYTVSLTATDSDGSADSLTRTDYITVTACLDPVRIAGATPVYYSTLQAAYDAAVDGDVIQSRDVVFIEDLNINLNKSVTLEGGYNCDYTAVSGKTTINGIMTISDGISTVGNFIVD